MKSLKQEENGVCGERAAKRVNKRKTGAFYEETAEGFLKQNGYRILQKNYRCRGAEIDLIAMDGDYLVFVEVKYRKNACFGDGTEAVDRRKQHRIIRGASCFLSERNKWDIPCRFDVVAVSEKGIVLIRDAFTV